MKKPLVICLALAALALPSSVAAHPGGYVADAFDVKFDLQRMMWLQHDLDGVAWCTGVGRAYRYRYYRHVACSFWIDWSSSDSICVYYHPTSRYGGVWSVAPDWWQLTHTSYGCKAYAETYIP